MPMNTGATKMRELESGPLWLRNNNGTWKRRQFVLKADGTLSYYNRKGIARGGLFLSADWYVADSLLKKHGFQISNFDRVVYLAADNLKARISWMVKIAACISALGEAAAEESVVPSPDVGSSSANGQSSDLWGIVRGNMRSLLEMEAQIERICERLSHHVQNDDTEWADRAEALVEERLQRESTRWHVCRPSEELGEEEVLAETEVAPEVPQPTEPSPEPELEAEATPITACEHTEEEDEVAAELLVAAIFSSVFEVAPVELAVAEAALSSSHAEVSALDSDAAATSGADEAVEAAEAVATGAANSASSAGEASSSSDDEIDEAKSSPSARTANLTRAWERKVEAATTETRSNPFSQGFDASAPRLRKGDAEYGRARKGSLTEARAAAALAWVEQEIQKLVRVIKAHGSLDESGQCTISFGELFALYATISDTLVGILMRARKRRQVGFEADMLFQGVHDHVPITLLSEDMPCA